MVCARGSPPTDRLDRVLKMAADDPRRVFWRYSCWTTFGFDPALSAAQVQTLDAHLKALHLAAVYLSFNPD